MSVHRVRINNIHTKIGMEKKRISLGIKKFVVNILFINSTLCKDKNTILTLKITKLYLLKNGIIIK